MSCVYSVSNFHKAKYTTYDESALFHMFNPYQKNRNAINSNRVLVAIIVKLALLSNNKLLPKASRFIYYMCVFFTQGDTSLLMKFFMNFKEFQINNQREAVPQLFKTALNADKYINNGRA